MPNRVRIDPIKVNVINYQSVRRGRRVKLRGSHVSQSSRRGQQRPENRRRGESRPRELRTRLRSRSRAPDIFDGDVSGLVFLPGPNLDLDMTAERGEKADQPLQ